MVQDVLDACVRQHQVFLGVALRRDLVLTQCAAEASGLHTRLLAQPCQRGIGIEEISEHDLVGQDGVEGGIVKVFDRRDGCHIAR